MVNYFFFELMVTQEHEETKATLAKLRDELTAVKKESHKRKKLLVAQQQLMSAGSGSYNKVSPFALYQTIPSFNDPENEAC